VLVAVDDSDEPDEPEVVEGGGTTMMLEGRNVVAVSVPVGSMLTIGTVGFSVIVGVWVSTRVDEVDSSVDVLDVLDVLSFAVDTGVTLG
jgi:hypothetical protein